VDLTSGSPQVKHAYSRCGDVSPTLWVTDEDPDGAKRSLPYSVMLHVNHPPVAAFQVSNFSPQELDIVTFTDSSHDSDGKLTAWKWDFGDEKTSSTQASSHIYQKVGTYTVRLTVTDNNGAQGSVSAEIKVGNLPPVAQLGVSGKKGKIETQTSDELSFDASSSRDKSPCGRIVRYEWDLTGDGTYEKSTADPSFSYAYPDDGIYHVRVRVTDNNGATAISKQITVVVNNRIPSCSFTFSPHAPTDIDQVTFSASVGDPDGKVVGYHWDFGDKTCSTNASPTHLFPDDGTYTVTLVVTDDDGAQSPPYTHEITVRNALPIAAFNISATSVKVGIVVRFTDLSTDPSPTGRIVHVAWSFGDGTFCPGTAESCGDIHTPTHVYTKASTYTAILVVIDEQGAMGQAEKTVVVHN